MNWWCSNWLFCYLIIEMWKRNPWFRISNCQLITFPSILLYFWVLCNFTWEKNLYAPTYFYFIYMCGCIWRLEWGSDGGLKVDICYFEHWSVFIEIWFFIKVWGHLLLVKFAMVTAMAYEFVISWCPVYVTCHNCRVKLKYRHK